MVHGYQSEYRQAGYSGAGPGTAICSISPTLIEPVMEFQVSKPEKMEARMRPVEDYFAIVMLGMPVLGISVTVI